MSATHVANVYNRVLIACRRARTSNEYAHELVRQIASIGESQFCIWLRGTRHNPEVVACTGGGDIYMTSILSRWKKVPCLLHDEDAKNGLHSLAVVPVRFQSLKGGVLAVGNRPGGYSPQELTLLLELAAVALMQYESLQLTEKLGLSTPSGVARETVARFVHKVRQPLSTIDSCAYYLDMILPDDAFKARAQVKVLQRELDCINRILSGTDQLFAIPPVDGSQEAKEEAPVRCDLTKVATSRGTY